MSVLLFIAAFAVFLTVDYLLQRNRKPLVATPVLRKANPMRTPAGIFFSKSHTWLSLFPSGKIQLGIDDFLAHMFKTPQITMLKNATEHVTKGEPILRLAEGKNELLVRSPIHGTIANVNAHLSAHPALLKQALFSEGWAYTMTPDHTSDLRAFYLGEDTGVWLKQEMGRLRDFFAHLTTPAFGLLQDGGLPVAGVIDHLDSEQCKQFETEFLRVE
jgi:glycine cleavage system H protein